ncbi:hypothetical protein [Sutcliffiella deserti]|uniref:hypothetical protein n=1 Tax=Sutcliffiella deserti TaxID=2875501 RepID=UPI001CC0185D|nr:hypothetical protein [Sutcliffiella deserti]
MDKHQVKIKINGKEKSFNEGDRKPVGNMYEETFTPNPTITERNDFPEEEDLPIIIVDELAASAEKHEDEEFEWVLPKEPVLENKQSHKKEEKTKSKSYIEDLRTIKGGKGKKNRPTPLGRKKIASPSFSKQLIVSILMAVGIGTCLGFLILGIMNMSDGSLNPSQPAAAPVTEGTGTGTNETTKATGEQSVTLASQAIAVLQGGAFTTSDAATATIQQFQSKGFSAAAVNNDPIYVFVGIGQSVEGMKTLGGMATEKGLETYAKDFTIPEKTFTSLTTDDVLILQEGQALYKELLIASSLLLQGKEMDPALQEKIDNQYTKIADVEAGKLTEGPTQWKEYLTGAYQNLQQYQTTKDNQQLWDAQQKLLEATSFLF